MQPERMPIPRLAGQRLMVGFNGTAPTETLTHMIGNLNLGGVILFKRNLETPNQIKALCGAIQEEARRCALPPLFIGIDQEGGTVARLPDPFTRFKGNAHIGSQAEADAFAVTTAGELQSVGINMNMAPVLDVAYPDGGGVMRDRSFGADPDRVALLGRRVIAALQAGGVMAVAKHFPGIGRTTLDSHVDMPTLDIDPGDLLDVDLVPFSVAIQQRVSAVMLAHVRYPRLDPVFPASLSGAIARDLLRGRLGYNGVVMTDDLDMGAIARHHGIETVIERALAADIDIALICHEGPAIQTAFETMVQRLENDAELKHRGIQSVRRIMELKGRFLGVNKE